MTAGHGGHKSMLDIDWSPKLSGPLAARYGGQQRKPSYDGKNIAFAGVAVGRVVAPLAGARTAVSQEASFGSSSSSSHPSSACAGATGVTESGKRGGMKTSLPRSRTALVARLCALGSAPLGCGDVGMHILLPKYSAKSLVDCPCNGNYLSIHTLTAASTTTTPLATTGCRTRERRRR